MIVLPGSNVCFKTNIFVLVEFNPRSEFRPQNSKTGIPVLHYRDLIESKYLEMETTEVKLSQYESVLAELE